MLSPDIYRYNNGLKFYVMIYGIIALSICFLCMGFLYYRVRKKYRKSEENLDMLITRYVELVEMHSKVQKDFNQLSDKYRYKLSLIAVYQDKISEINHKMVEFEKNYNLLMAAYNENKDNLRYAENLLTGNQEEL